VNDRLYKSDVAFAKPFKNFTKSALHMINIIFYLSSALSNNSPLYKHFVPLQIAYGSLGHIYRL